MENEKFQELVLEHLAQMTQEITELKQSHLETNQYLNQIEKKLDITMAQTAQLTESQAMMNQNWMQ